MVVRRKYAKRKRMRRPKRSYKKKRASPKSGRYNKSRTSSSWLNYRAPISRKRKRSTPAPISNLQAAKLTFGQWLGTYGGQAANLAGGVIKKFGQSYYRGPGQVPRPIPRSSMPNFPSPDEHVAAMQSLRQAYELYNSLPAK